MPGEEKKEKGFEDLMRDLEDNIFSAQGPEESEPISAETEKKPARRTTLPTLVDNDTANKIFKDFMKEKNQRKYDAMGVELMFKPYWFFTYTCELIMRDKDKNITDSEEMGGRVAVDAINGSLADYLQDLLDHEPIEVVDLADELAHVGGSPKVIEPKISEDRLEKFVQLKIAGAFKGEKENVSVAGFELMWSPVYRFWVTIKKKTHNVQIDGCGGYPVNYDDVPLKAKTWTDIIQNDMDLLKDPKKWKEFLKNKRKAVGAQMSSARSKGGASRKPGFGTIELLGGLVGLASFLYGMGKSKPDYSLMAIGAIIVAVLFWYGNHARKKPLVPLPAPPYADYVYGPPAGPGG